MREIQYNVDIEKQNYEYKACMQNDDLKITLNVYNNASEYDLAGAKAILNFAKPDGTPIVKKDDITVEENIITCALDKSYTDVNGKANIEFEVTKNGTITTFPVELVIVKKAFQSEKVNNKIIEVLETIQMDEYVDEFLDGIKKKQTELSSQIAENANLLDARIDAFTTLTEGSTTGDAELVDIRVGINGTIYENAGAAVRAIASGEGLGDKSIDIVKLDAKLQSKFEKTTTTTEVDGDSYAISKYMIVWMRSVVVVLPASIWAMMPMFLVISRETSLGIVSS